MQEKIKKLDQAVASSSKLLKELKWADTQYLAMGQAIADFWDTSDVPQDHDANRIPSYPSLESLDQEYKEELSDIQYAYYNAKGEAIMKKIDTAYEIYSAHLKEYEEADPKTKTQKYLLQYNDISNRLHGQFEVVTSMLGLPFKETSDTYPSLDSIMRVVEQENLRNKGESFFEELLGEIEIKNAIAAKVYQNKSLEVTDSMQETEITKEFEDYKKESKKLIDFCRRMMDKRSKREEYEELEQPQGVPDVKPISKEELDEKIKEAWITSKEAQNIGENTIPPQYSREISRYEPPIPIKEKEKEDLLEKVREITSGESKESKDEKQAEGETELPWDHEGLEPYPSQERPKPQRGPKVKETSKENVKYNETLNKGLRDKESQEEMQEPLKRAKENLATPKPNEITPKELEKVSDVKRGHPKEGNEVNKNTEQWVNDQNKFWEKKRENLEETIPKVFEPQGPVKILQKGKQPQPEVTKQTLIKTRLIGIFGTVVMVGPIIEMGIRWDILVRIGIGSKGMDMVEGMAMGININRERPMEGLLSRLKHITPPQREGSPIKIHHPEEWVENKEMVMGMVKIKMIKIEESIEILNMILKKKMRKRVILKILLNLK